MSRVIAWQPQHGPPCALAYFENGVIDGSLERELAIERTVDAARDAGIPVRVQGPLDATDVIARRA
jgi:hypothetical protein